MKNNWKYQHIIDLEYFLHQDSTAAPEELHTRDRSLYLKQVQNQTTDGGSPAPNTLIRLWLDARNRFEFSEANQRSPGCIFQDTLRLARKLLTFKGFVLGIFAGLAFFTYTGTTPVNVFHFLLLFILPQIGLLALLACVTIIRLTLPKKQFQPFYLSLFRKLIQRLTEIVHKKWLQNVPAQKRTSIHSAFGILKTRNKIYGSLFYWPFFGLAQLFGIGFNIGLLTVTLLKIVTNDLAFGWQSTVQFSGETLSHFVQYIALPWSWLIPGTSGGYPSLAEIEGSRIILKEGIYHLTTANLIAWWPFLVLCLFTYGLLIRTSLYLLGSILERRAFKNIRFDTPACLSLVRRMQAPVVTTQAPKEHNTRHTINEQKQQLEPDTAPLHQAPQTILIPDDIFDQFAPAELGSILHKRGFYGGDIHRFMRDYDTDQELLQILEKHDWQKNENLFILMEGWMPPLRDFLSLLENFRTLLPPNTIINLGLIGKPEKTLFTPLHQRDLTVWTQKISSLSDPYLSVFPLVPQIQKP